MGRGGEASGAEEEASEPARAGLLPRLARAPIVHFLLIGLGLLVLDALGGGAGGGTGSNAEGSPTEGAPAAIGEEAEDEAALRRRLRADFLAAHGRAMSALEEGAALERHRDEEALFREALELGLHRTDPVVRRRLIQRMRFLEEDTAELREPSEAELEGFVRAHPERLPPVRELRFEHRFFSRARRGASLAEETASARARLEAGEEVAGDPFPRRIGAGPEDTGLVRLEALARQVGPEAAEAFFEAPEQAWSAPIRSAYGLHLVRSLERRTRPPALAEVRERARALWLRERRAALGQAMTRALREGEAEGRL